MDEHQAGVVLEMACFKDTDNCELLEPRQHARGSDLALGRNQHELVPGKYSKRACEFAANDDTEPPRRQVFKFAVDHHPAEGCDPVLHVWQNTSYHNPAHNVIERDHALRTYVGRSSFHLRMLECIVCHEAPIGQPSVKSPHLDMRCHPQDASTYFFLKTVHNGHDRDEGCHTER